MITEGATREGLLVVDRNGPVGLDGSDDQAARSTEDAENGGTISNTASTGIAGGLSSADLKNDTGTVIEKRRLRQGRYSTFMNAMALFIALNMVLSFTAPLDFDKFNFPYKGWAWWTFNDLRTPPTSTETHNVALLGSSLMVSAINNCEAMFKKERLNLAVYHKATYLDRLLEKKFGGKFNTYNLSGPGQNPSDAYMTLQAMLKLHQRPDVVVYGVAPRDFYDSSMASPVDTEAFRFLHRLVNIDDSINMMFRSPWDKLNWVMERNIYLYGNGLDLSMIANNFINKELDAVFPPPPTSRQFTYWDRVKLLPKYKMGEIHPLAVVIHPQSPKGSPRFTDNTPEYIERYKNPDDHIYKIQWHFLLKLVELCKRERIELVIVNMPITLDNIRVLIQSGYKHSENRYLGYVYALRTLAQEHDVQAFDLNDFAMYTQKDYHDGVHLNAFGGTKLINQLVGIMGATYTTRMACELSGHELQQRSQIPSPAFVNSTDKRSIAGPKYNADLPL